MFAPLSGLHYLHQLCRHLAFTGLFKFVIWNSSLAFNNTIFVYLFIIVWSVINYGILFLSVLVSTVIMSLLHHFIYIHTSPPPPSLSRQGHKEVFGLIHSKALYSALLENLIPLLEVDTQVGKVWIA